MNKRIAAKVGKCLGVLSYSDVTRRNMSRHSSRKIRKMFAKARRNARHGDMRLKDRILWGFDQLSKLLD